ncbi:MAG TPA: alcohol dehydrogenase catalytic domain-containing protein [Planctomycetota bacterium]|jgi:L-iditol 2-dehydrogenase
MKRAILTGPHKFRIDEIATPKPGPGEALLRVKAVGVCGSDLHLFREGIIGGVRIEDHGGPFSPGHEGMGVVEDVGSGADRSLIGKRIAIEPSMPCKKCRWCIAGKPNVCPNVRFLGMPPVGGCLGQYILHPAEACEVVPKEINDDEAVLLEPLAVSLHSIDRIQPPPGSAAVVLGAGTIGLTHVMMLAHMGMNPLIVTDVIDHRLAMARELGATHTFNPKREDVVKAVADLTHGAGVESVFECVGHQDTFEQMVAMACPAGRVGVAGIPDVDLFAFKHSIARRKGLDVLMIRRANLTFHRAMNWVVKNKMPLRNLATHHWPLEKVTDAFETAAGYKDGVVKAIVNP